MGGGDYNAAATTITVHQQPTRHPSAESLVVHRVTVDTSVSGGSAAVHKVSSWHDPASAAASSALSMQTHAVSRIDVCL